MCYRITSGLDEFARRAAAAGLNPVIPIGIMRTCPPGAAVRDDFSSVPPAAAAGGSEGLGAAGETSATSPATEPIGLVGFPRLPAISPSWRTTASQQTDYTA